MQTVTSKISDLYIGKAIFIHIFAFSIIGICINYLQDIYYIEKRIFAGIIIIAIIFFLFTFWQELMKSNKIIVDSIGIKIYNVKSIDEITFSEIERINICKAKTYLKSVQITDGYSYSEIILKQKPSLIISPDKFDNYIEIMSAIENKLNNYSDRADL